MFSRSWKESRTEEKKRKNQKGWKNFPRNERKAKLWTQNCEWSWRCSFCRWQNKKIPLSFVRSTKMKWYKYRPYVFHLIGCAHLQRVIFTSYVCDVRECFPRSNGYYDFKFEMKTLICGKIENLENPCGRSRREEIRLQIRG